MLRSTDRPLLNNGIASSVPKPMGRQHSVSIPEVSFTFRSDRLTRFEFAPAHRPMPDLTILSKIADKIQQDRNIARVQPFHPAFQRGVPLLPQSAFDFRSDSSASFDTDEVSSAPVPTLDLTGLSAIAIELGSRSLPESMPTASDGISKAAMNSVKVQLEDIAMHGDGLTDTAAVYSAHLDESTSETGHSRRVSDGSSYQAICGASDAGSVSSVDAADEMLPHIATDEDSVPTAQFIIDPVCLFLDPNSKLTITPATPSVESGAQDSNRTEEHHDEHGYLVSPGLDLFIAANYPDIAAGTKSICQPASITPHGPLLWHPKPERLAVGENHVLNHTPGRLAKFTDNVKTPPTVASSTRQCYAIMSPSRCGAIDFPPPTPVINRNLGKATAVVDVFDESWVPRRPYRAKKSKSYEVVDTVAANSSAKHVVKDVLFETDHNDLPPHEGSSHTNSYLTSSELLELRLQNVKEGKSDLDSCTSGVAKSQSKPPVSSATTLPTIIAPSSSEPSLPIVTEYHVTACFPQQSSTAGATLERSILRPMKTPNRLRAFVVSWGTRLLGQAA